MKWLILVALTIATALPATSTATTNRSSRTEVLQARLVRQLHTVKHDRDVLGFFDKHTWMFNWRSPVRVRAMRVVRFYDAEFRWTTREITETRLALMPPPPHRSGWLCIHGYEGSWHANTGNGYYGGLQMDMTFQRHYGGYLLRTKGTADHWTPLEQMWVAERAHRSGRGFYPWPNTARYCGLI